jgi:hypothetical protein
MGLGSSLKKFTKKTFGDYSAFFIPSVEAAISGVSGALSGAATGAAIGGVGAIPGAIIGGVTGVASGSYQKMQSNIAEEAAAEQLAMQREIANRQAAAAAVPVATSAAKQQTVDASTVEGNYAAERKRALSVADTSTSSRLQRWASNGKRRIL